MNINRFWQLFCVMSFLLTCGTALAGIPSDIIANLSEAKARAEGRAQLLQSCTSPDYPIPVNVKLNYEDARAAFNAQIEALTLDLRTKKLNELDASTIPRLNDALNRVDKFVSLADKVLERSKCTVIKKASIATSAGKIALGVISSVDLKAVFDFIKSSMTSDADREEFIKRCEAMRILEWDKVRVVIVFDWQNSDFYFGDAISPQVLSRGSTSIYVNGWALSRESKAVNVDFTETPAKALPAGLSSSYKLYTGDPKKLMKMLDTTDRGSANELIILH